MSKRVVIAGGSGFLGTSLAAFLSEKGYRVCVLSRKTPAVVGDWGFETWDARSPGRWYAKLDGADALVNLAGRSVDCIKTPDNCDEILRSRTESTLALGRAIRNVAMPPPVWVQMGTAHIYGDPATVRCTEESAFGYGLAPFVGQAWEKAFADSALPTQRCSVLRTGFVLGRNLGAGNGALARLEWLVKRGLGGPVGSGQQGMSWIHETDMNRIFLRCIEDDQMSGPFIASAPNPVSQKDFMATLRRQIGVPVGLPASKWMVRFGARFVLQTDPDLALYGRYVLPMRLLDAGFAFEFETLGPALQDLYPSRARRAVPQLD